VLNSLVDKGTDILKQPETSIPSFAELLLKYDMVTQDQLNEVYRFMEEKKADGESYSSITYSSLEEVMLFKKILTQYQVNLIQVVRDFLVIKKKSDHFGYVAVQKGYATPQEVKYALKKQLLLFREKKIKKMIGDILVEAGVLTKEQQQIIVKEQQVVSQFQELNAEEQKISELKKELSPPPKVANTKEVDNIEDQTETVEVIVLPNAMEAWVKVITDTNTSDPTLLASTSDTKVSNDSDSDLPEPMLQKKPITLTLIKSTLKKKGVTSGILSNAILQCHIDRKDSFFPTAVGEYQYSNMPEYEFNLERLVGDTVMKKNKTLAFLQSDKIEIRIKDVYGRIVEFVSPVDFISSNGQTPPFNDQNSRDVVAQQKLTPDDHPVFRCGNGVTLSEDGMRVLSNQGGYPAISMEGRLYIFPVVNVLEDADMRFGPINPYASLNVSGILTGAYPVNAGQVKAREIHGATLSSIGDISVEIGIIGSRIKTQGSIRAKYIHNSWIEAFGDVVVEHEILDSTIIISGRCNAPGSRILASRISAKRGIIVAGVGSYLTEPSDISVGCEEHIVRQSLQVTRQINIVRKELDEMMETKESLKNKIKETFKNMVELKSVHDRAKAKSLEFSEEIDIAANQEEKDNTTRLIDDLKTKMKDAVDALKKYNQQKKILELRLEKAESSIRQVKPKVEKQIMQLELDRNRFLKWAEAIPPTPEIRIYGRLAEGTRIKGLFASMTVQEDVRNIQLLEKRVGTTLETYEIEICTLKEN